MKNSINAKTSVYGIIGNPVEHSMSPLIHNKAFDTLDIDSVYVAFKVENNDVENAIKGIRSLNILGLSVTIPHKMSVIKYLDEIDPVAEKIGAVNTIVNKNGKLFGTNSDGYGAYKAIKEAGIELKDKNVVIIGSGGAGRAIGFTICSQENINRLDIVSIDFAQAKKLSLEISKKTGKNAIALKVTEMQDSLNQCSLVINTSPIGMSPNVDLSVIPKHFLKPDFAVFDIVYNPVNTKLLSDAESVGCKIIYGTEMFLNQAIIQFELWTGQKAPQKVMRNVLNEALGID